MLDDMPKGIYLTCTAQEALQVMQRKMEQASSQYKNATRGHAQYAYGCVKAYEDAIFYLEGVVNEQKVREARAKLAEERRG